LLHQISADRLGASRTGRYVCRHRRADTRFKQRRVGVMRVIEDHQSRPGRVTAEACAVAVACICPGGGSAA
jgi:hypothetical protein